MPAVKSVHALTSRSIQSRAKSAASRIVRVTIALATTVLVMTALGGTAHKGTAHKGIARKAIVHAPMKRVVKHLAIVMAKASAITPHARALPHAGKPALKAVPMIASRASQPQARKPSAPSPSASVALAHVVALMSGAVVTAASYPVAVARKIAAYTCSGSLGLSR